mmetsp:Transcript_11587/g.23551  ORF Transcript_11587/g.23551 Transcript_11587/m.23551 type:complete len:940 (-) Transcript_11587:472-3291(-)
MVKAYLGYRRYRSFGTIASGEVPVRILSRPRPTEDGQNHQDPLGFSRAVWVASSAGDALQLWNMRDGRKHQHMENEATRKAGRVTVLEPDSKTQALAAGHQDGSVRVWDPWIGQLRLSFSGHRSPVSSLAWSSSSAILISGSSDGDLTVWDTIGERGQFRIHGAHTNAITVVLILESATGSRLISGSKDGVLKVFDLVSQHCIQTIVGHRGEIWSADFSPDRRLLVTGSADSLLRFWEIRQHNLNEKDNSEDHRGDSPLLIALGAYPRRNSGRTVTVRFGLSGQTTLLAAHGADKVIELFSIRTAADAERHRRRRKSRRKEKQTSPLDFDEGVDAQDDVDKVLGKDYIKPGKSFQLSFKIRSIDFVPDSTISHSNRAHILIQMTSNCVETFRVPFMQTTCEGANTEVDQILSLDSEGHRGEIRSLAFSSLNDSRLISVSTSRTLKVWEVASGNCLRTIATGGYGISCLCLPMRSENREFGVVATKEGTLAVFDLESGSEIARDEAHGGPVWSVSEGVGEFEFLSGGGDRMVHFWKVSLSKKKLEKLRSLEAPDEVLGVRATSDGRLVVTALLDATVRAYHGDSLKPFLSFYGHKLPVMSLDISSDGAMLITGSADKSIKIWDLDYGNCRKSLRAHEESVMSLCFQPRTHYFFSGSRDGVVKYWDGDRFECISELDSCGGGVWHVKTSRDGEILACASQNRSVHIWIRSDEQIFLEEERDRRLDEMFERSLVEEETRDATIQPVLLGTNEIIPEVSIASKATLDTTKGAESLIEALRLSEEDRGGRLLGDEGEPNPLLLGLDGLSYVIRSLRRIRPEDLEQALLLLPLNFVFILLRYCKDHLEGESNGTLDVEQVYRVVMFLMRMNHNQIVSGVDRALVDQLRSALRTHLSTARERIGFNVEALRLWAEDLAHHEARPFADRTFEGVVDRRKKRGRRSHG